MHLMAEHPAWPVKALSPNVNTSSTRGNAKFLKKWADESTAPTRLSLLVPLLLQLLLRCKRSCSGEFDTEATDKAAICGKAKAVVRTSPKKKKKKKWEPKLEQTKVQLVSRRVDETFMVGSHFPLHSTKL